MRAQLVGIAAAALAGLALSACQDDGRNLLAPQPDKALVPWNPSPFPKIVLPNPEDFVDIVAGDDHTCARKNNGNVYCWGSISGRLAGATLQPTLQILNFATRQVVAGKNHNCVLRASDGAAYCWGADDVGQLGLAAGQFIATSTGFVTAPTGESQPASYITLGAGGNSTCGVTSTALYCWGVMGSMMSDSLLGGIQGVNAPFRIASWYGIGPSLALGGRQGCIRLDSTQGVYCWGINNKGQAGVDPAQALYYPKTSDLIFAQNTGWSSGVSRVSAHADFTCADKTNGTVECFGDNSSGQLGLASTTMLADPWVPRSIGGGKQLQGVSAGVQHACALDPSGNAWCWGDNYWGQLGAGKNGPGSSVTPVQVVFDYVAPVTFRAIAAGSHHTCAIGKDNHIYCWGQFDFGQLGIGSILPLPPAKASSPLLAIDP